MKRVIAVAFVLVAVAAHAAHVDDGSTTVRESECYSCHFQGGAGFGPALTEMFRIFPEPVAVAPGETADLGVTVVNWWTSELSEFQGRLDLTRAPAFTFADAPDAIRDQQITGTLPFSPGAINAPERTRSETITVPLGGTDLVVGLEPERSSGEEAPNLILRLWRPSDDPAGDPAFEVDAGGPGEMETITLEGDPVPDGRWTIEVAQKGFLQGPDRSKVVAQPYTITWDLLYEYDNPVRFTESTDVLDGQELETNQETRLTWPVMLREPVNETQEIHVEVVARSYYNHPDQFGAVDEWYIVHERTITIDPPEPPAENEPDSGNGTVSFGGEEEPDGPSLDETGPAPASTWGEIIGYFAAFLMVASLVSGGTFGHWSRRLQNWVLFKKSKRRVAFHNLISYSLIFASLVHLVLFLVESRFPWTLGMFLGGVSLLGMAGAGFTGAFQVAMIRSLNYEAWRWLHWLSFVIAFAGAGAHIVLDGIHFTEFQNAIGWEDPVAPWLEKILPS